MTTRMPGRVTHLSKKQGHGFILGEGGCRVYFEKKALSGLNMHKLFIGSNVEYRVRYGPRIEAAEVRGAVRSTRIRFNS